MGVTPELAAKIVRDYLLPMFESRQRKATQNKTIHDELELTVKLESLLQESRDLYACAQDDQQASLSNNKILCK